MPTTFSTALPAIATITRPANVGEMCTASMAGVSAATNHSDTNAALTPAAASSPMASARGHCSTFAACAVACRTRFSGSCPSLATAAGRDTPNRTSSTTAVTTDKAPSWPAAVAKDGQEPEKRVRHATAQAANVEQWPLALAIGLLAAAGVSAAFVSEWVLAAPLVGATFTLVLSPLLLAALLISALVTFIVVFDGESTWFEGTTLIGL